MTEISMRREFLPVTKGCPTVSATDPIAAEQHPGQRAGRGACEWPVEPLPAGAAGRAPRHRHQEGKWHEQSGCTAAVPFPSWGIHGRRSMGQRGQVWGTLGFVSKSEGTIAMN